MKRIILLGIVVFLCLPFVSYAASIGGAETQGQGKFSIGLDQEFVFDRDIKDKTFEAEDYEETVTFIIDGTPIDEVNLTGTRGEEKYKSELDRMSRSMIKLSYGIFDNLDIFARLGEAHLKWKGKGEAPHSGEFSHPDSGNSGTYIGVERYTNTMKGKSAFAWGLGLNGIYPLENDWLLGVQAQYLRHKNSLKSSWEGKITGTYEVTAGPDTGETGTYEIAESGEWKAKATFQEWQVAPYIARKLGSFVPYFGVKYSDQRIVYKGEGEKIKFKADDNFGVFVGTDYKLGDNWKLNLEGRFVDETAMSFGATYRF